MSALGAVYGVCEIVSAVRRLRELRAERDELLCDADGGARALAAAASEVIQYEIETTRRLVWKLGVDTLMCLNWAWDHPRHGFGEGAVGALGVCSAYLGLRLKWSAHQDLILQGIEAQEAGEMVLTDERAQRLVGLGDDEHGECDADADQ